MPPESLRRSEKFFPAAAWLQNLFLGSTSPKQIILDIILGLVVPVFLNRILTHVRTPHLRINIRSNVE